MTPCAEAIALAISALPGAASEHVPATASAIAAVSETPRQAALLVTVGYFESRFLPRIQAGECRSYRKKTAAGWRWEHECDGVLRNGAVVYQSRSYWQHKEVGAARPVWDRMVGLAPESVGTAASVADQTLERCVRSCRTDAGAASCYATGGSCTWPGGYRRGIFAERVRARLEACVSGGA